ncbi:MAG: hypothetical protein WD770_06965 [Actinomycetota bacterium]
MLLALVAVACSSPSNNPPATQATSSVSSPSESPPAEGVTDCETLATAAEVNTIVTAVPGLSSDLQLSEPETATEVASGGPFPGVQVTTCNYSSNAATVAFYFGQGRDATTVRTQFEQSKPPAAADVAGLGDAAWFSFQDQLLVIRGTTFLGVAFLGGGEEFGSVVALQDPQALHVPLATQVLDRM